jgi:hypothetical protein
MGGKVVEGDFRESANLHLLRLDQEKKGMWKRGEGIYAIHIWLNGWYGAITTFSFKRK